MVGSVKHRLPPCSRESGVHIWDTAAALLQDFNRSVAKMGGNKRCVLLPWNRTFGRPQDDKKQGGNTVEDYRKIYRPDCSGNVASMSL